MGTDGHVIVVTSDQDDAERLAQHLCEQAFERLEQLEARWSRFRPDSELVRLNAVVGGPVVVAPITFELIRHAVTSWQRTDGAYDPTVAPSLVAAGYDRDFRSLSRAGPALAIESLNLIGRRIGAHERSATSCARDLRP